MSCLLRADVYSVGSLWLIQDYTVKFLNLVISHGCVCVGGVGDSLSCFHYL